MPCPTLQTEIWYLLPSLHLQIPPHQSKTSIPVKRSRPSPSFKVHVVHLLKPASAPSHNLTLTNKLGVKLRPIKREVDVKVNTVESSLRGIHALKVFF